MIAVDTSALMAVILREPAADACINALVAADRILLSAGTLAEALIVAARRNVAAEVHRLIEGLGMEIISVDDAAARRVAAAYARWGKGSSQSALNFGDCFAYEVAQQHHCPLLYVGRDFAGTDVLGLSGPASG